MSKIGIVRCSNVSNEAGCSSIACLGAFHNKVGHFSNYKKDDMELVGIANCAGCPTAVAPEKFLKQIRIFTELGTDAIHLSSCISAICPFREKYKKLIETDFPNIKVVVGTHSGAIPGVTEEQEKQMFQGFMKEVLTQPKKMIVDMVKQINTKSV